MAYEGTSSRLSRSVHATNTLGKCGDPSVRLYSWYKCAVAAVRGRVCKAHWFAVYRFTVDRPYSGHASDWKNFLEDIPTYRSFAGLYRLDGMNRSNIMDGEHVKHVKDKEGKT